ncbi:cholinesterase 1-like [Achroia grisella]|uniref:cholinesterase 1-like n=1 Tax=Achroia grisella TaxID=688607 RepID=UPI0027D2B173|nr:cholinesterase 1-like [Achroia grisella]
MKWELSIWIVTLLTGYSLQLNLNKRPPLMKNLIATNKADDSSSSSNTSEDEVTEEVSIPDQGSVKGINWKDHPNVIGFIDIPYGKIDEKKPFQAPESADRWEDPLNNQYHTRNCYQLKNKEVTGTLDCLTLSIFKPKHVERQQENASVLFYIHGGNFIFGSGDPDYYRPAKFVDRNIIVVLPNYRLGPLGFLCLQNETVPGNAGLKDLALALNWTRKYIQHFGGNSSNIVLSGDGRSGALVQYLALSPKSKDYVSKVITESGSVLSHWAIDRNPLETAQILEGNMKDMENQESVLKNNIFEDTNITQLLLASVNMNFKPCIENNVDGFITKTPWYILENENITKTFMLGFASHAGLQEALDQTPQSLCQLNTNFSKFLPNDLSFDKGEPEKDSVANLIKVQYFDSKPIFMDNVENLSLYYTDAYYISHVVRLARQLVKAGATVYVYEFSFVGDLNRQLISLGKIIDGTARGDIVGYLFVDHTTTENSDEIVNTKETGVSYTGDTLNEKNDDQEMSDKLIDLWVHFIKSGNPSEEWETLNSTEASEEKWLSLNNSTLVMREGIHEDRIKLWTEIYKAHFVERNWAGMLQPCMLFATNILLLGIISRVL